MNAPHFQLSHVPVSTLRRRVGVRNMCRVTVVRQLHHGMVTQNAPGGDEVTAGGACLRESGFAR